MNHKKKPADFCKIAAGNLLRCIFSVLFVTIFQMIFGAENTLVGVAVSVGVTMYPECYTGLRPLSMGIAIVVLITGGGIVSQFYFASPWLALPVNFLFGLLIMTFTSQPAMLQPAIVYLLTFVFAQATAVPMALFKRRLLACLIGGFLVAAITLICWKRRGYGANGHTLAEHAKQCLEHPGYILRMSTGLSAAMFIGMILHVKKPLWISIVVMSLTQPEYTDTKARIKNRSIGTMCGFIAFIFLLRFLIPERFHIFFILFLGYIGFFTTKYRYKQIINAICALNASLLLLDTPHALLNRALCLVTGIIIVLILWKLELTIQKIYRKRKLMLSDQLPLTD